MTISILHPTRGRKQQAISTANTWLSKAIRTYNIEYILSVDDDDPDLDGYRRLAGDRIIVLESTNRSAIDAINNAAKVATGDLFVVVSDDFDCPRDWDVLLLHYLEGKSDFVVKTDDGCQPWIITLPIMDRVYYNRFGYVYYPPIKHMFVDTWMTHVADLLDRKITLPLKFRHNHYTQIGGQPRDEINVKNDSSWDQGEKIYLEGIKDNFGLKNFTGKLQCDNGHIQWLKNKGVIL